MMKKYESDTNINGINQQCAELGVPLLKTTSSRGLTMRNPRVPPRNDDKPIKIVSLSDNENSRARHRSNLRGPPIAIEEIKKGTKKDPYFRSYDRLSIHQEMLKDKVRTLAFKDAIYYNKHLFKDKVVLDVGCGTGILSLFAAKAGAALVIGIDCSDIVDIAQKIVQSQEPEIANRIVLVKGRVEDVSELPNGVKFVDIIVSEWMGYCLFFESMLDTVLYARQKWLKRGGLLFPDKVSLYIAGMEDRARRDRRLTWWHDVFGFNMSPIRKWYDKLASVEFVDPSRIVTDDCLIKEFDLYKVNKQDLSFTAPIVLTAVRDDEIQGLVTFFTVEFTKCHTTVQFSKFLDLILGKIC